MKATEEWISKKELLAVTGISYGQLYRWKRQNLIPESWFIKQSSFTGQETYFPKYKVLQRIEKIIELKDLHSLEELSAMLNPEATQSTYSIRDVATALAMDDGFLQEYIVPELRPAQISFVELLFLYCIWRFKERLNVEEWKVVQSTFMTWLSAQRLTQFHLYVYRSGTDVFAVAVQGGAELRPDVRWEIGLTVSLEQLSAELQDKLLKLLS